MKKIFFLLNMFFYSITYSQDNSRIFEDCSAFPSNDNTLDQSVSNLSNKILENRTISVNHFNTLTKEQKIQLQNAINNNDITFINSLPGSINILNNFAYLQSNYQQSLNRVMELNPGLDSLRAKEKLREIIECSLIKLSPDYNTENELARIEDCVGSKKKCDRRAGRNFAICTAGSIFGGFFTGLVGGVVAYEICVVTYAYSLEDCKEDYEDCLKK